MLLAPLRKTLLKTMWEMEKVLVNSIFSFYHNVFKSLIHWGRYDAFCRCIYSLPNYKILVLTKSKEFADDIIIIAHMMISVFDMVGNIARKAENAGNNHSFSFLQCFPKTLCPMTLKFEIIVVELILLAPPRKNSLKTMWETENVLVNSILSFSHNVFYPMKA